MPGQPPLVCIFPDEFLQEARLAVRRRTILVQEVQRYRIALLIHDHPTIINTEAGQGVGLSERQFQRWRHRWAEGDFTVEDREGRGRKTLFVPDGSDPGYRHRLPNRRRNR
jgi:hypothetical protein